MNQKDFEDLFKTEQTLWWFQGMKHITATVLQPVLTTNSDLRILDAGCGTGDMMTFLKTFTPHVTGLDISVDALKFAEKRHHDHLVLGSVTSLPFESDTFHLITSFDVLVQLPYDQDDRVALREMFRVLRPGGFIFLRVAAYPWMRSYHDVALHSQKRYTIQSLCNLISDEKFKIRYRSYVNCFLFPLAVIHRLILKPLGISDRGSDVKPLPRYIFWLNTPFRWLLQLEAICIRYGISFPFGLSIIMLLQKPNGETIYGEESAK